uniref:Putative ovule protein n=1 Tax=Solanum chacoense TaxID=4108 RepID=A0A0V0GK41_SOLCH
MFLVSRDDLFPVFPAFLVLITSKTPKKTTHLRRKKGFKSWFSEWGWGDCVSLPANNGGERNQPRTLMITEEEERLD